IRPAGTGDITESHVVWSVRKAVPNNPSPLLVGDELYMVSDKGIASCLDARTGALRWRERLGGNFSASPISADGRIYFFSEEGITTVLAPGRRFQKLATNKLEGRIMASPAVSGSAIFLRTQRNLYSIARSASP
ncbi:MAG: PQQ-binding-like beta-propeller repeat protein, partial [Planctomycetota bacterium]|nr:PQQ-binding-like beta-propeller repeat protein [Planctomycetota bacterium]